jgi:hypothetical protein
MIVMWDVSGRVTFQRFVCCGDETLWTGFKVIKHSTATTTSSSFLGSVKRKQILCFPKIISWSLPTQLYPSPPSGLWNSTVPPLNASRLHQLSIHHDRRSATLKHPQKCHCRLNIHHYQRRTPQNRAALSSLESSGGDDTMAARAKQ